MAIASLAVADHPEPAGASPSRHLFRAAYPTSPYGQAAPKLLGKSQNCPFIKEKSDVDAA